MRRASLPATFLVVFTSIVLSGTALATMPVVPQIANPGFEQGADGWSWGAFNGVKAGIRAETKNPHSGKSCLMFTNDSTAAPNVYARLLQNVVVLPDTEYELSVWVRGTEVSGENGVSHLTDWSTYTLNLPTGTFGWRKVSTSFRTGPGQRSLQLGFNIANSCKELAVDDIFLKPVGTRLEGDGIKGSFVITPKVIGHNASGSLTVFVDSSLDEPVTLEARINGGSDVLLDKEQTIGGGEHRIDWDWTSGRAPFGSIFCSIHVLDADGRSIASGSTRVEKVDSPISAEIDRAEARFEGEFTDLYRQCRKQGISVDYPTVTKTMLEQFIPLARKDVQNGLDWRAGFAAKDFRRSLDNAIAEMKGYLADPKSGPVVRRYRTGRVDIDGVSFIGDREDTTGKKDRGPVFFVGYGHFGQVRTDMPKWPSYGVNIIQIEIGPSAVLKSETEVDLKALKDVEKVLDNAAKHNVMVNVLLSAHYFPGWAYEKWPQLAKGGGGFFGYCVDEDEAKQVIAKSFKVVVPALKDKPALHSFCLSNEPSFERAFACDNTKAMWEAFLTMVHGDVKTMNERYGTNYASFADVPFPGWQAYDKPQYYDYCTFLEERFAGWHQWMADEVHSLAPKVPVHAKIRSHEFFYRASIDWGIDPELFCRMMDIDGNDCIFTGWPGKGWFGHWQLQNMAYDLQRSFGKKPIFNSENHPTLDRSTDYVAPEHFRTCLWQGAIHGQGATTIWVWERSDNPASDFYGNVMDRPGCAESVGTTCLDLNRFADEVTALQNVKAPVAIAFSMASVARSASFLDAVQRVYTALNFCGIKIDFISEKQLQEGKGRDYKMIILPQISHVVPATFEAVKNLPESTRLIFIGESLVKDPYGKPYPADQVKALRDRALCLPDVEPRKNWPKLREELRNLEALPDVSVVDAKTGEPVWGVEWLPVKVGGRTIVDIDNLTTEPAEVKITVGGRDADAKDLLTRGRSETVRTLQPFVPVLAAIPH